MTRTRGLAVSVAAFMAQFKISRSRLEDYFGISGGGAVPRYVIRTRWPARAQIQFACMQALGNAILRNSFEFSFEGVRAACREGGCLDEDCFESNFERRSYLFKSLDDPGCVVLSAAGREHLAEMMADVSCRG